MAATRVVVACWACGEQQPLQRRGAATFACRACALRQSVAGAVVA